MNNESQKNEGGRVKVESGLKINNHGSDDEDGRRKSIHPSHLTQNYLHIFLPLFLVKSDVFLALAV